MFKKRYLIIVAAIPFAVLNGCTIGAPEESKSVPIEKIDMSRYENKSEMGVFKGVLNEKFIDIKIGDKTKTMRLTDEAKEAVEKVKEGDIITFVYSLNEKTYQNELHSITEINKKPVVVEKEEPKKDELKVKEEKPKGEKTKIEVNYKNSTKVLTAYNREFFEGKISVLDGYEWDGDTLTKNSISFKFTSVEDTIEDDVQKERWRAASVLKEYGEFKESEEKRDLDDVRFIFNVDEGDIYREIMVLKNKYGYFRVETEADHNDRNNAVSELEAMINSIN